MHHFRDTQLCNYAGIKFDYRRLSHDDTIDFMGCYVAHVTIERLSAVYIARMCLHRAMCFSGMI